MARQAGKDYVLFPALSLRRWRRTLTANVAANLLRNVWAYVVICCGHFADGAEKFTPAALEGETKPEWYLRQMLGTANFDAGPMLAFLSGNLCYQIEHHLFPDLPSNRYAEIAQRVRAVCATYDLPYTTGPLVRQYLLTLRTISKLALPDRFLTATSDDAPENGVGKQVPQRRRTLRVGRGQWRYAATGIRSLRYGNDKFCANQGTSCTAVALRDMRCLPLRPGHVVGHLMMRSPQWWAGRRPRSRSSGGRRAGNLRAGQCRTVPAARPAHFDQGIGH